MSEQSTASQKGGFANSLQDLLKLVAISGAEGTKKIVVSAMFTSVAALVDAASLGLLRQTMTDISGPITDAGRAGLQALLAFLCAALVGSVLRLLAVRYTARAQFFITHVLSMKAFTALQNQQYADYLRRGASEGFAVFERLQLVSTHGIAQLIAGIAACFSAALMLLGTLIFYPLAGVFILLALTFVAIETIWRSRRAAPGVLSGISGRRARLLYDARNAFRDIFLTNSQRRICGDFGRIESSFRLEQAQMQVAAQNSRHVIEISGVLAALLVLSVLFYLPPTDIEIVPILAVLAFATLRLLPQIAVIRSTYRVISMHADVSADVHDLLSRFSEEEDADIAPTVSLQRQISVRNISFSRDDRPRIFSDLELQIQRGARIGISGASGVGKSTLLDIICGAIEPDKGEILIDDLPLNKWNGYGWRERLGVVSQNPLLMGETLRDAIVYPQRPEDLNAERFDAAIAGASIKKMVAAFPLGLDTPIGEAVAFLSGGQKQRLALGHALYRARDLLVLDEATGQLDDESEQAIITTIKALPKDLTIIISSHRPAIFECCDIVYSLVQGRLAVSPIKLG